MSFCNPHWKSEKSSRNLPSHVGTLVCRYLFKNTVLHVRVQDKSQAYTEETTQLFGPGPWPEVGGGGKCNIINLNNYSKQERGSVVG
jgi:hypothetical protein